jgi:uncharacterized protein YndB with AHSA1/START domain
MASDARLPRLNLRRWYAAPPELVFRAFTEPAVLVRWFRPSPDVAVEVAELDVRVGGRYRFVFHFPGDRSAVVIGEYRAVAPPHRLGFTWTWEPPDPHAGIDTLVSIELKEKKGGTELVLIHASFPTEEIMRQHESGWSAVLETLSKVPGILRAKVKASD